MAGHLDILGNKEADKEAKKAADGMSMDEKHLPNFLRKTLK